VKVGTPIAVVGEEGASAGDSGEAESKPEAEAEDTEKKKAGDEAEEQAAARSGQGEAEEPAPEEEKTGEKPAAEAEEKVEKKDEKQPAAEGKPSGDGDRSKRGIISPLVRRLADEHGVELEEIEGSGTGGRIRKQDVLKFVETRKGRPAAKPAASAEPAPEPEREEAPAKRPAVAAGEREELVPWTNIRRRTAEHMVASAREVARAWNAVEVDWTNVAALRSKVKDSFKEREGFSLTFMPFLGRVICDTLLEMPEVNATFDEENQANRVKHYVNLGIAVALEGGGLIVPVVKGADEKNLVGLARGISDVASRARNKKLSPDDIAGGTFTITNPGQFGAVLATPIINQPQVAILDLEAVVKRPVVIEDGAGDSIAIRPMTYLCMSWDHCALDGVVAARFLGGVKERLENWEVER
jgi:2-oxoglutarate dehydrogenase E2 component (dihydrolipoamide succinyltransferase)